MKLKIILSNLLIVSNLAFTATPSHRFLETFFGHCVYSAPNFERLLSVAEINKWKKFSDKESQIFGPIDKESEFKGWHISNKDDDYYLAYTKGLVDDQVIDTCTIFSSTWNASEVRRFLTGDGIAQKLILSKKVGMQNYDAWSGKVNGFNTILMMTTYDGLSGGTLSLAVKATA